MSKYAYSEGDYRSSVYVTLNPFFQKMKKVEDVLAGVEFRNGIEDIAARGVEVAQKKVLSSGTAYSNIRQRLGLGGRGRYVTGRMYASIGSKVEQGPTQLRVRVGFIKGTILKYFKLQEEGFDNVWKLQSHGRNTFGPNADPGFAFTKVPARRTEGMFALRDAREAMLEKRASLFSKLRARIRKI